MTIDELIKSLVDVKQTYGNINVRVCDTDDLALNITDISVLDERKPKEEYKDTFYAGYDYDGDCMEDTGRKELILWTT